MNRRLLLALLCFPIVSCTGAVDPAPSRPSEEVIDLDEEAPAPERATGNVAADDADAEDPSAAVMPSGTFDTIAALCDAQKKLVAEPIARANEEQRARGEDDGDVVDIEPACAEDPDALTNARIDLGGGVLDVAAVSVETGQALDTFLVLRTRDGWTAVRPALLSAGHDDPGCPSIERENAIVEVRAVTRPVSALVVVTSADRAVYDEERAGTLDLTHARACALGKRAVTCSPPRTIAATRTTWPADDSERPETTEVFATAYRVGERGELEIDTSFEGD